MDSSQTPEFNIQLELHTYRKLSFEATADWRSDALTENGFLNPAHTSAEYKDVHFDRELIIILIISAYWPVTVRCSSPMCFGAGRITSRRTE